MFELRLFPVLSIGLTLLAGCGGSPQDPGDTSANSPLPSQARLNRVSEVRLVGSLVPAPTLPILQLPASGTTCADVPMWSPAFPSMGTMRLSCPAGEIVQDVGFASYGTPTGSCGSFMASSCNAANTTAVIQAACLGSANCTLTNFDASISDPCPGTAKHLAVQVTCGSNMGASNPAPVAINAPQIIPFTDPDFIAPGRGAEVWHSEVGQPINNIGETVYQSPLDKYNRSDFRWSTMEPAQGVYNFATFDSLIESAIANRQKFSFNIMSVCPYCNSGISYPAYLHAQMQSEANPDWHSNVTDVWMPNYNSPSYRTAVHNLLTALRDHINARSFNGKRYKDALGYIDISLYGSWGEWNHSAVYNTINDVPLGTRATGASLNFIIDEFVAAFPDTQLVIPHGAFDGNQVANMMVPPEVGCHALTVSNNRGVLGWKRMNYGWSDADSMNWWLNATLYNNPTMCNGVTEGSIIQERWKFAPVVGEGSGFNTTQNGAHAPFWDLLTEVTKYHSSSMGNGNYQGEFNQNASTTDASSVAARANLRLGFKTMGYRVQIEGGSVSPSIHQGTRGQFSLIWHNVGIAPVYEDWLVQFQLVDPATGAIAWTGTSSHVLRRWLPAAANTVTDNLLVPASVPVGTYDLILKVSDPIGYRDPFPLAIRNRRADGGYLLRSGVAVIP